MYIKNVVQRNVLSGTIDYLCKDPFNNVEKFIELINKLDFQKNYEKSIDMVRENIIDENSNWHVLIDNIFRDIDVDVIKKVLENFLINSNIVGTAQREKAKEKYQCNIPWAILMDPTSACNLKCIGCWAAEYGNNINMDFNTLDEIIRQGKELGTYMYLYSGGEPLTRKDDIIKLCEKHNDCQFLSFTNATLIDEKFCSEVARVKNFIPAISVEGFEESTDSRRGKGTYKKIINAMEIMNNKRLPFGISCCYTRENTLDILSEEFFDEMIRLGAKFAWFFTYMPIGKNSPLDLMVSADQREYAYSQIRKFRKEKPIFTIDFWNDGEYVKGCIAGGRNYIHINSNGDIEPCAFIHYSDSNIKDKTLLESYRSPLFMQYRANQPFNDNHLRPCPLLDNPGKLTNMVNKSGAFSTDMQSPEDVEELSCKCINAAKEWKTKADQLWENKK